MIELEQTKNKGIQMVCNYLITNKYTLALWLSLCMRMYIQCWVHWNAKKSSICDEKFESKGNIVRIMLWREFRDVKRLLIDKTKFKTAAEDLQ